ncbi:MAG TPA: cell envelope integrity protein TolA [Rudaea sp.]
MENFGDKARAFVYALIVHALCIVVMFFGLFWTKTERAPTLQGPIIEATLVGQPQTIRLHPPPRPKPPAPKPPEPQPEPPKPEPKEQPPSEPQRNDAIEREKVAEMAQFKAEQVKQAEEERRKQEQVKLDQEKKEAAEREKLKQLEDIRKKREAAEKARKLEQEKLAQLEDVHKQKPAKAPPADVPEAETPKTGAAGTDTGLQAEYIAALSKVAHDNWNRPDNAQPGLRCAVHVIQLPGGDVMSATTVSPCNADLITRNSIEQAVTKAQPLPYKGYEKVFSRELTFIFTYNGN